MLENTILQSTETDNGWIISLLEPVPPIKPGTTASEFCYEIKRPDEYLIIRETSDICIGNCPDLEGFKIINCSLTITYKDAKDIENAPVTMHFKNACEVENTPPGSECRRILLFDGIPSGNQAVGGNYIQDSIILCFSTNENLLVGSMEIISC